MTLYDKLCRKLYLLFDCTFYCIGNDPVAAALVYFVSSIRPSIHPFYTLFLPGLLGLYFVSYEDKLIQIKCLIEIILLLLSTIQFIVVFLKQLY